MFLATKKERKVSTCQSTTPKRKTSWMLTYRVKVEENFSYSC